MSSEPCPWCGCPGEQFDGHVCEDFIVQREAERIAWLEDEVRRKDAALDASRNALAQLSKTGSLRKDIREETLKLVTEARNERLF